MKNYFEVYQNQLKCELDFQNVKRQVFKTEMTEDQIQSIISHHHYTECLDIRNFSQEQKSEFLYTQLANLTDLRGLALEIPAQTLMSVRPIQKLLDSLVSLSNLRYFSLLLAINSKVNLQESFISLGKALHSHELLEVVSFGLTNLDSISIQGMRSLAQGIKNNKNLTTVQFDLLLQNASDNAIIQDLFENISDITQLKNLNIRAYQYISYQNEISHFLYKPIDFAKLVNLTSLNLTFSRIYDLNSFELPKSISLLRNLKKLYLSLCYLQLSSQTISLLQDTIFSLKNLETLSFKYLENQKKEGQSDILLGSQVDSSLCLKELYIEIADPTVRLIVLEQLQQITTLEHLSLLFKGIKLKDEDSFINTANLIKICSSLKTLKVVINQEDDVKNAFKYLTESLKQHTVLTELKLEFNFSISQQLLKGIESLTYLKNLQIQCASITNSEDENKDNSFSFKNLKHLKTFKLILTSPKEECLENIEMIVSSCKQLETLQISLSNTPGMKITKLKDSLEALPQLKHLTIQIIMPVQSYVNGDLSEEQMTELLNGIKKLHQLQYIALDFVPFQDENNSYINQFTEILITLKNLRHATFYSFVENKEELPIIQKLKRKLRHLLSLRLLY